MVSQYMQFVSSTLPLTVGNGTPEYRQPFVRSVNPSETLRTLATNTQQSYNVNPYISDPVHAFDANG